MQPIVITGGHHNSALVIAQKLIKAGFQIVWFGHRHSMLNDPHDSLEYQEVTANSIRFINLIAGKFHHTNLIHILRMPLGLIQALYHLSFLKPQLILSFGGYIAVPVSITAKLFKIPIITFEQTTTVGRANALISKFSHHNVLAWESSLPYFPSANTSVLGLPLNQEIFSPKTKPIFSNHRKTLLITGGKQGSHALNKALFPLIKPLLKRYNIVHQTGASKKTKDFYKAQKIKEQLSKKASDNYIIKTHLMSAEMINVLKNADLVIGRSGAHITYELLTLKKPALLIPLPFSFHQEQLKNAQKLAQIGSAKILLQKNLTSQTLRIHIQKIIKNLKKYQNQAQKGSALINPQAADQITKFIIEKYIHAPHQKDQIKSI